MHTDDLKYKSFKKRNNTMQNPSLSDQLVAMLADGQFHSGEAIGEVLGVSRAAVWKRLQALEALGLSIESVKGKGYRLKSAISLFDQQQLDKMAIEFGLPAIALHRELDSTNAELLRLLASHQAEKGQIVLAEKQTAGRGRRGRSWSSPYAANVYLSLLWTFERGMRQLDGLSLVVGLALQRCLAELGFCDARIKWPNDVLVANRKIAGILLEINGDPTDEFHVVIGIGLNVNMLDSHGSIDQAWTSLQQQQKVLHDKHQVLQVLLASLLPMLAKFERHGFNHFVSDWSEGDALHGQEGTVTIGDQAVVGEYRGVNANGELKIATTHGERTFNGGEVSIRKFYHG